MNIEFNVSEVLKLSRIVKLQRTQWIVLFKNWFIKKVKNHYWSNCLYLVNCDGKVDYFKDMNIGELTQALFDMNYPKILAAVQYNEDKVNWWNNIVDEYNRALALYERLYARGLMYRITHCGLLKKASKRLKEKDCVLTAVDIAEVGLCRYMQENHGDVEKFIKFMN